MNELDKFLIFLMENTDDDRINIWKKMKYGYRHYYISLHIDQEKEDSTGNISSTFNIIEETLSSCARKDLHRDYKMKKIFKDDEPI